MGARAEQRYNNLHPQLSDLVPPQSIRSESSQPSSLSSSHATTVQRSPVYIVSIAENRLKEVGIAALSIRAAALTLHQFVDSATYLSLLTKLSIYEPVEILLPAGCNELTLVMKSNFADAEIVTVTRKYYNESRGESLITSLAHENKGASAAYASNSLALAAAAALLKYVEFIQNVTFASHSLRVELKGNDHSMVIDREAVRSLELLRNARTQTDKETLFSVVNHTKTQVGARLLRTTLLSVRCGIHWTRLDCIEEFLSNERMHSAVTGVLSAVLDLDHLLSNLVQIPKKVVGLPMRGTENSIANVIYLKHQLEVLPKLGACLESCRHELLIALAQNFRHPSIDLLRDEIGKVINEEAAYAKNKVTFRTQLCFAIKPGINGLLDVARKTYLETNIQKLAADLREAQGMPGLRLQYAAKRGYFLSCPLSTAPPPNLFTQIQKSGKKFIFSSEELLHLNMRMRESMEEIFLLTARVLEELNDEIRKHIGIIFKITDCIAFLDLMCSFTTYVSRSNEMCRPELAAHGPIAIKEGRHPILDDLIAGSLVANDIYLDEGANFGLITGPNMSGKSTYLKQVALLTLLAHCGCFVPAKFAGMRLTDRIFCRMGTDDDVANNSSSFMREMKETSFIVQNCTHSSLVLIDELGRGTGTKDGVGIAFAVCEFLLSTKAYSLVATHYPQLARLESLYPNAKNYHLKVEMVATSYYPVYTVTQGAALMANYGVIIARGGGLPEDVLQEATRLLAIVEEKERTQAQRNSSVDAWRTVAQLAACVLALRTSSLDPEGIATLRQVSHALTAQRLYLRNLKQKFVDMQFPV